MKKLMLSTAIMAALSGAAWSQTADTELFRTQAAEGDIRASDLIGMRLYSTETPVEGTSLSGMQDNWEDIGEVNDVILSQEGNVEAVLVDIGGFLGIGERQVAVQMASLQMLRDDATENDPDDFFLVLNANRAALENAPAYSSADASGTMQTGDATTGTTAASDQQGTAEGGLSDDQPPVTVTNDGTSNDGASTLDNTQGDATAVTNEQSAPATTGEATTNAQAGTDAMEATGTEGTITTDGTTQTMTDGSGEVASADANARSPIARDGFNPVTGADLTAEMLTSAAVYDARDNRIGEVADLVLDSSGQVTEVVFDVGGFLGIGEKRISVPIAEVDVLKQAEGDELRVYVSQTEDQLKEMPTYEG